MLLGCDTLPEPEIDRAAFAAALQEVLAASPAVYDPLTLKQTPWI